jgi:hypothetical protein
MVVNERKLGANKGKGKENIAGWTIKEIVKQERKGTKENK